MGARYHSDHSDRISSAISVECSQRHGQILSYEYEIIGQDDWAKLERQIANTTETRITIDGLTPYTKARTRSIVIHPSLIATQNVLFPVQYVFRVRAYNGVGGGPATENLDVMTAKANAPLPPQDLVVTQEGISWYTPDSRHCCIVPPPPHHSPGSRSPGSPRTLLMVLTIATNSNTNC